MARKRQPEKPDTLEDLLDAYENAAILYATETGPDADYRRMAQEDMREARQAVLDFVKGAAK